MPGDPTVEEIERRLAARPAITVPTVAMDGGGDGVAAAGSAGSGARFFTGRYQHRLVPLVGHNLPQEAPKDFAEAILSLG